MGFLGGSGREEKIPLRSSASQHLGSPRRLRAARDRLCDDLTRSALLQVGHQPALPLRLAVSADAVLVAGQFTQAHRTAGVQLVGRDPDFRPEPELLAVGKPRRNVVEDTG